MKGKRKRISNGEEYVKMTSKQLSRLPAFDENGVVFYKIGRVLLGKEALLRWVQTQKAAEFNKRFPNP